MGLKVTLTQALRPDTKMTAKVFIIKENKLLLLLRKENQAHPRKWDLPGGHLVVGETWLEGATRETREETNLLISDLTLHSCAGRHRFYRVGTWHGDIFEKENLPEHDDWKWFTKEEIRSLTNISDHYREMALEVL
jgi:ADP-ribose pyrophosphatase YjhB (NUDIX family)